MSGTIQLLSAPAPERPMPTEPDEPIVPDPAPAVPPPFEPPAEPQPEPLRPDPGEPPVKFTRRGLVHSGWSIAGWTRIGPYEDRRRDQVTQMVTRCGLDTP